MVISTHLPPPVIIDSTAVLDAVTHILCCSWAVCFSAAASSENVHGNMNLASKTAPVPSTMPSSVAAIHRLTGWKTRRWTALTNWPVLRSYQRRLSSSVTLPSWTIKLPDRSSGSASPRFSRHSRSRAASSSPMMIRASEPPMKLRLSDESANNPPCTLTVFSLVRYESMKFARLYQNQYFVTILYQINDFN